MNHPIPVPPPISQKPAVSFEKRHHHQQQHGNRYCYTDSLLGKNVEPDILLNHAGKQVTSYSGKEC
jgi:hypothetical protein